MYNGDTHPYTFIDALFTAISAFSDTGLTSFAIMQTYNIFGQIVICLLIQVGGMGLFTIYWILWNVVFNNYIYKKIKRIPTYERNKIGFSFSLLMSSERGNSKLGLSNQTIKSAVIFILTTELIFAIFYSLWFGLVPSYVQVNATSARMVVAHTGEVLNNDDWVINSNQLNPQYHNPGLAIWTGIFQSVSTMNNAGFDVIGNSSLSCFRNGTGTIFQIVVILQFVIGGIGYPVIYDVLQWIKLRHRRQKFRFSLFTKVSLSTYFIVALFGLILLLGFEFGLNDSLIYKVNNCAYLENVYFGKEGVARNWNEFVYVLFNAFSSRSAGFATVTENDMSAPAKWVMIILMFIGCAPSSTGGGIRTTTLAVMFMATVSKAKGFKDTRIWKRSITQETVISSLLITVISVALVVGFALISYPLAIKLLGPVNSSVTDLIFEFASAYGTVGLTSGISPALYTNNLNGVFIAIFICIVMIIGQLGVPSALFVFKKRNTSNAVNYPVDEIRVG
ncbi:potassium transporter TrkG [Ureaplasma sp. OM1]|uniref:Potassium transporter TrkG n=1 Tax=Ureaplasma ceti TaxID=3119530 RepID=A0ABP9U5I4_9BACT